MLLTNHPQQGDQAIIDTHFRVKCPHCRALSGLSAISLPKYNLVQRYQPKNLGIAYQCDACQKTVFLRFGVRYEFGNSRVHINDQFSEVERPSEEYEFEYLPEIVALDFREALTCYSNSCFNAFAAMCRRTIQTASANLGAQGSDKVQNQVNDLRAVIDIDEETIEVLQSIIIAGHDGAHPHLPELSSVRAEILFELMKDVLYQLFVRKKKLEEAAMRRKEAIEAKKG